jgi:hypothetical protein
MIEKTIKIEIIVQELKDHLAQQVLKVYREFKVQ